MRVDGEIPRLPLWFRPLNDPFERRTQYRAPVGNLWSVGEQTVVALLRFAARGCARDVARRRSTPQITLDGATAGVSAANVKP